ncbi:MAG: host specificity protein [Acidobacteria bacterium]|nr:MAG: host specificity protein [Acidobacteriota bacterium]
MKMTPGVVLFALGSAAAVGAISPMEKTTPGIVFSHQNLVLDLWEAGRPAFGIYVPANAYTVEGAAKLAENPLYDYLFLNLEGKYDPAAVKAVAEGLRSPTAVNRKTIIVRIPPIDKDGPDAAKARIKEILDAGADGVTLPHIQNLDEAKMAVQFFKDAGANVWSPQNPKGEKIAMLMLEDPVALTFTDEVARLPISILACGIGSLRGAIQGTPEERAAGAEAGTQKILAAAKRAKLADMLTANTRDVEQRVKEGFLALLMQGPTADEAIRLGLKAAGR